MAMTVFMTGNYFWEQFKWSLIRYRKLSYCVYILLSSSPPLRGGSRWSEELSLSQRPSLLSPPALSYLNGCDVSLLYLSFSVCLQAKRAGVRVCVCVCAKFGIPPAGFPVTNLCLTCPPLLFIYLSKRFPSCPPLFCVSLISLFSLTHKINRHYLSGARTNR